MENKQEKIVRFIVVILTATFMLTFLSMFFNSGLLTIISTIVFPVLFTIGIPITMIMLAKAGKEYRDNLMASKPKRNFKYLDSFYYMRYRPSNSSSSRTRFTIYHVIKDTESEIIYAIHETETNVLLSYVLGDTTLYRNDNVDGITWQKDWKIVDYDDQGSFWINEELSDYYKNDGNKILIGKEKLKDQQIFNRNGNYDISLLEKATFISGYAKFEPKN